MDTREDAEKAEKAFRQMQILRADVERKTADITNAKIAGDRALIATIAERERVEKGAMDAALAADAAAHAVMDELHQRAKEETARHTATAAQRVKAEQARLAALDECKLERLVHEKDAAAAQAARASAEAKVAKEIQLRQDAEASAHQAAKLKKESEENFARLAKEREQAEIAAKQAAVEAEAAARQATANIDAASKAEAGKLKSALDNKTAAEKARHDSLEELKTRRLAEEKSAEQAKAVRLAASTKVDAETSKRIAAEEQAFAVARERKQAEEKMTQEAIARLAVEEIAKNAAIALQATEREAVVRAKLAVEESNKRFAALKAETDAAKAAVEERRSNLEVQLKQARILQDKLEAELVIERDVANKEQVKLAAAVEQVKNELEKIVAARINAEAQLLHATEARKKVQAAANSAVSARLEAERQLADEANQRARSEIELAATQKEREEKEHVAADALRARHAAETALLKSTGAKIAAQKAMAQQTDEQFSRDRQLTTELVEQEKVEAHELAEMTGSNLDQLEGTENPLMSMHIPPPKQPTSIFFSTLKYMVAGVVLVAGGFIAASIWEDNPLSIIDRANKITSPSTAAMVVSTPSGVEPGPPFDLKLDTQLTIKP